MRCVFTPSDKCRDRLATKQAEFSFYQGVTLLIGANGSGKSSLLRAMRPKTASGKFEVSEDDSVKYGLYFDFEKDNPRTSSFELLTAKGEMSFARMFARLDSEFDSHGETQRKILKTLARDATPEHLVLLDEPEQALDYEGLVLLKQTLRELTSPYVVVATHSPYLILNPSFHVIELTTGYQDKIRSSIEQLLKG